MLYEIEKTSNRFSIGQKYVVKPASAIGLLEKNIEDFIAQNPKVLFPNEEILVLAQSISFKNMADVLALDAAGNLIIVEIKRDHSSRDTVAQLLEYAAKMKEVTYDELNDIAKKYHHWTTEDLKETFEDFSDDPSISVHDLAQKQRIVIVAPQSDEGLQRIVNWLRSYNVPIEFVPFNIYADATEQPKLLEMKGVEDTPDSVSTASTWRRHWIFNTNETFSPGAYQRMFSKNVAAIYGYTNGPRNLQGSTIGDKVFAYVNKKGIMAIGEVTDPVVKPGTGVFFDANGQQVPDEYQIGVQWKAVRHPMTASEASKLGYHLPVRTVFGKLHNGLLADKIERELQ